MILSTLALAAALGGQTPHNRDPQPTRNAQDAEMARSFLRAADAKAPFAPPSRSSVATTETEQPEFDASNFAEFGIVSYQFRSGEIWLEPNHGRIFNYRLIDNARTRAGENMVPLGTPRPFDDARATDLAKEYFRWSRQPYDIHVFSVRDYDGADRDTVTLSFVPEAKGVPYDRFDAGGHIDLDRATGRLKGFVFPVRPLVVAPPSLTPGLSLDDARRAARRSILSTFPGTVSESPNYPLALTIWRPFAASGPGVRSAATPNERRAAAEAVLAGRKGRPTVGRLVYAGQFEGMIDENGRFRRAFNVHVDALTGRVLDLWDIRKAGASPPASSPASNTKP